MDTLKKIDMFSRDFSFSIDGGSFKTHLGGVFSIFIGFGYAILTGYFGKDLYFKKDPNYLFKYDQLLNPPFYNLTRTNFVFGFELVNRADQSRVFDKRAFYLDAQLDTYFYKNSLNSGTKIEKLKFIPCDKNIIQEPAFSKYKFNTFRCLNFSSFILGGGESEGTKKIIAVYLKRCSKTQE